MFTVHLPYSYLINPFPPAPYCASYVPLFPCSSWSGTSPSTILLPLLPRPRMALVWEAEQTGHPAPVLDKCDRLRGLEKGRVESE